MANFASAQRTRRLLAEMSQTPKGPAEEAPAPVDESLYEQHQRMRMAVEAANRCRRWQITALLFDGMPRTIFLTGPYEQVARRARAIYPANYVLSLTIEPASAQHGGDVIPNRHNLSTGEIA